MVTAKKNGPVRLNVYAILCFPCILLVCEPGTYGEGCKKACGHCLNRATCHHIHGKCTECEGNFFPPYCTGK